LHSIAKARELCQQLNPKDPKLELAVLTELSQVQALLRRFPEAQLSLEQALSIAKNLPEGSVEMADTLEAQGALFETQGQKEKAQAALGQALPLYRRFVGSFYGFSILEYVRKLERAELRLGHFREAEEAGQRSLKTYQDSYGPENPRTALALMELARAQKGTKKDKEAGDNAVEALRILQLTFPSENPLLRQAKDLAHQMGR
jgi:tetratricopeptide (TPR) repeat protein